MGQAGSQTPTIPPAISPTLPARGCHRNGATSGKDQRPSPQPDVAGPRTRSSRGLWGAGGDGRAVGDTPEPAPRRLLPTPAHIGVPISSHQHNPVLPGGTLTFAEAVCGEQGGHWKRQRRRLAPAPQHPKPYSTRSPAAPATPRPLPRSPGHPKPAGFTQQHLSPPALGVASGHKGYALGGEGKKTGELCPWGGEESAGLAPISPCGFVA